MAQRFCVLPGQEPVRLAKTDGRVVLIGEELREIPEDMIPDAYAKGAISEERLADLKKRLAGDSTPDAGKKEEGGKDEGGGKTLTDDERTEAIKQAVITILNGGDPAQFSGKKPKVDAIEALTGFNITAAERDAAFAVVSVE